MGARDIFAFVSRIDFFRKIAQMLYWLEFRDTHGLFSTVPFFDHAGRGVQNQLAKRIKTEKAPYLCPTSKMMALLNSIRFLIHSSKCIASCWLIFIPGAHFRGILIVGPCAKCFVLHTFRRGGGRMRPSVSILALFAFRYRRLDPCACA